VKVLSVRMSDELHEAITQREASSWAHFQLEAIVNDETFPVRADPGPARPTPSEAEGGQWAVRGNLVASPSAVARDLEAVDWEIWRKCAALACRRFPGSARDRAAAGGRPSSRLLTRVRTCARRRRVYGCPGRPWGMVGKPVRIARGGGR
jgi:hypothetical protein